MIRDNKKVYEIAKMFQEKGIFTIGIVYPAVRTKEARLRVSVLAPRRLRILKPSATWWSISKPTFDLPAVF